MHTALFTLMLFFSSYGAAQDRRAYLPDSGLTPGETVEVTKDDICNSGQRDLEGKVPVAVKRQVFDRYGLGATAMGYNVDHLIPERLGGSSSIKNLWPQPLSGEWSYQMKNRLERRLHRMVCSGALDLETARREIAADWVAAYKKYLRESNRERSDR